MRIAIIGLGGVGSWLLHFMAPQLEEHEVHLYDGDVLEAKNLERANYSYLQPGTNKAEAAHILFVKRFGFDPITVYPNYLKGPEDLKADYNYIFVCVDDYLLRLRLSQAKLDSIRIYGANELVDGDIVYEKAKDDIYYRRYHRYNNSEKTRAEMSCMELAELPSGGQTRAVNVQVALLMYSLYIWPPDKSSVWYFNLESKKFNFIGG